MHANDSYTNRAATATLEAARTEQDFGGWLAGILARTAAELGSTDALTAGRPGSWEAEHVLRLVESTAGPYLHTYKAGRTKLTDAQVREIRELYEFGVIGRRQLAAEFGVSPSTIGSIVNGKTWRWLS